MFDRIIALLEEGTSDDPASVSTYDSADVSAAVAALYYHMISADGVVTTAEIDQFRKLLSEQFNIHGDELNAVVTRGTTEDRSSPGLFPFTAILNREMDEESRRQVLAKLRELAETDGAVDDTEQDMLEHVARLLRLDAN
ncbi:TerB family tellurite resistance protein [Rhizobiaceae bacterium]|nr:TerB family tellurite resistance protein [Rhizobiaceae bacterium]